jgi:hypothetical protein
MESIRTFEHNGKVLQLALYTPKSPPQPNLRSHRRKPGAGKFRIEALQLSSTELSAGEEIALSAQIKGKNLAYIFTELLFHDKSARQAYGPLRREYVPSAENNETGGVLRPIWNESIEISIQFKPTLPLLTDGANFAFGFHAPEAYGRAERWLEGLYNESTRARLTFTEGGELKSVVAFTESLGRALPHELTFKPGDHFAPFVQIYTPAWKNWDTTLALSNMLTFGESSLRYRTESPIPGEYLLGLLVQDLDGGLVRKYAALTIQ